ncbi:hypothetical protein HY945_01520 [Candidatus Gottesmanbacteria bacterium]|nr:hypothetical protein [Candidatus Gottesmanbacteria bacterium]
MKKSKIRKKTIKKKIRRNLNPYAHIDWEKASKLFQQPILHSKKHSFPPVKEILHVLVAVGAIGVIFAFPGAAPAIGSLVLGENSYDRWKTRKIIMRLKRQRFVTIKENPDNTITVTITRQGMVRALTYQLETMQLKKQKNWDKKWRVVIFDIPEKYKKAREIFRMRLRQLSLYLLQDSVFVSPYPCFNEVEFLRELYGIPSTVKYLLVEKLEDDQEIKEYFSLV